MYAIGRPKIGLIKAAGKALNFLKNVRVLF
jgi:hypothetical protein